MDTTTLAGQSDLLVIIAIGILFALGWLAGGQR